MFDYCRVKMDFGYLQHIACSEIRAANLVHRSMVLSSSLFIGTTTHWNVDNTHLECVKTMALVSLLAVRKDFLILEGVKIIDKVFDRCNADLKPIGLV